jgi:hypothetical protein
MNPSGIPLGQLRSRVTAAVVLCAGLALAACTSDQAHEYLAHTDRVTRGAGNATASNRAIHTIDPWSPSSHKTRIDMDGKRAAIAAKRYETNTSIKPKGLSADPISIEIGTKN